MSAFAYHQESFAGHVRVTLRTLLAIAALIILGHYAFPPPKATMVEISVAIAFVINGLLAGILLPAHRAPGLLALIAAGFTQFFVLQITEAGRSIRYQHLVVGLNRETAMAVLLSALPLAALILIGMPWLKSRRTPLGMRFFFGAAFVLAMFVLTSATLSRDIGDFVTELVFASFFQAGVLAWLILGAFSLTHESLNAFQRNADRFVGSSAPNRSVAREPLVWVIAAAVVVTSALLNLRAYQSHPHIPDEVAYLIQARTFAAGKLDQPTPAVPEAFEVYLIHQTPERSYSCFPPGWPALLALGYLAGAPWIVNPLLAGACVFLFFLLVRDLYDRRTALLSTMLFAYSPWFLFLAMSFMSHIAMLFLALGSALAIMRFVQGKSVLWNLPAGLLGSSIVLIRPLDGVMIGGLLALWLITWTSLRRALPALFLLAAGALPIALINGWYNQHFTGSPTEFPVMDYMNEKFGPGANDLGFGANRGAPWQGLDPIPGHGLIDVLVNFDFNAFMTNIDLFGWGTGSILFIAIALTFGRWNAADRWMIVVALVTIGTSALYWFGGGPDFGARYWFPIIVPAVVLTVRGAQILSSQVSERGSMSASRVAYVVCALCLIAMATFFPWRTTDKYYRYRGMRPYVRRLDENRHLGRSLVLIRGKRHPDYASAAVYNPVDPNAKAPLFAWDKSPEIREKLLAAYPDRPVWLINGPTVAPQRAKFFAGPLSHEEARRYPFDAQPIVESEE